MGFNTVESTDSTGLDIIPRNQIHVDGVNVKVTPVGTSPTVVYRIGDGTVHAEGWDNVLNEEYLDFYLSHLNDADKAIVIEVGNNIADVTTVATNIADVITTAGISAEIVTVAGDSVNIGLVGTDLAKGIGTNQPTDSAILNALTNATQTIADAASTAADVVTTNADVVLTNADVALTNADVLTTNADVVITSADVVLTNADVVSSGTNATNAQLSDWEAEAERLTADSYATEAEDVFVNVFTSDGDGTFTSTPTAEYSSLHWAAKAEAFSTGTAVNIDITDSGAYYTGTEVETALQEVGADLDLKAPLASPSLTGIPVAPTATQGTNTTQLATTAFVRENKDGQVASNIITQGNIAIDATTVTKNFAVHTYTGVTGNYTSDIDIVGADFTSDLYANIHTLNNSGFYLRRSDNTVRDNLDAISTSGSCVLNTISARVKKRTGGTFSDATSANFKFDSFRGFTEVIKTDQTALEATVSGIDFTATNIVINGDDANTNELSSTYVVEVTLYTHIKWGVTSQGKFQIEAYNPVTKEGMIYYLGSGNAGHQISHSQGVKLDFFANKSLDSIDNWYVQFNDNNQRGTINTTGALTDSNIWEIENDLHITNVDTIGVADEEFIAYYKCKSETFDILQRQTSATADTPIYDDEGNYLFTADTSVGANTYLIILEKYDNKVVRMVLKSISGVGSWVTFDYSRTFGNYILLDSSAIEATGALVNNVLASTTDSFFDLPTDDTNLNLTAVIANYTDGKDTNGFIRSTETVTASVDLAGVSDGFKWVAKVEGGSYNFYDKEPNVGLYTKESADDNRLVFSDGKYYSTTGGELVTNGTFDTDVTGWTARFGDETLELSSARLAVTIGATDYGGAYQDITTEIGKIYNVSCSLTDGTASGSLILPDSTEITESGSFVALSTTSRIIFAVSSTVTGAYAYADNISVYKKEATLGTALTTPISLIPNPVMVQSETPQYIDYSRSLSENVMESTTITDLKVIDGFDLGQSWIDVTDERAYNVEEINLEGKEIFVSINMGATLDALIEFKVDGEVVNYNSVSSGHYASFTVPVPAGSTYELSGTAQTILIWKERR